VGRHPGAQGGADWARRAQREDPALIEYLRERQIPLEVCPTSNLCLGGYRSYKEHPVRWLWSKGCTSR